jgi:hypothetical protein
MTPAQEIIIIIEKRGGRLTVEGDKLVIEPAEAGLPDLDSLRAHKPEIMALLQNRTVDDDALSAWLLDCCTFDDRCQSGTNALYRDFELWCSSHGQPAPASRQAFVMALDAEGFDLMPSGYWRGLILRGDLVAIFGGNA